MIVQLIKQYPKFIPMYREIYELCRNVEKVMGLFSKELQILDKNTVQYMIDQMQDTIDEQTEYYCSNNNESLASQEVLLQQTEIELEQLKKQLEEQLRLICKECHFYGFLHRQNTIQQLFKRLRLPQ